MDITLPLSIKEDCYQLVTGHYYLNIIHINIIGILLEQLNKESRIKVLF
jgi:hypothetical protein